MRIVIAQDEARVLADIVQVSVSIPVADGCAQIYGIIVIRLLQGVGKILVYPKDHVLRITQDARRVPGAARRQEAPSNSALSDRSIKTLISLR